MEPGMNVYIRAVTFHWIGTVMRLTEHDVMLENASWIADGGRYSQAVLDPSALNEVERVPVPVGVSRAAIVDWTQVNYDPALLETK